MSFEQLVIYFGAPALCGLKSANLVSVNTMVYSAEKVSEWNYKLSSMRRRIIPVNRSSNNVLLFIYDEEVLYKTLRGKKAILYLAHKDYPVNQGLYAVLNELLLRLSGQNSFPHEVGIFLGYPLSDVISFEKDAGRSSKYSGMWQVYGNVKESCRRMKIYKQCSLACSKYLNMGMDFSYISKNYKTIYNGGKVV